MLKRAWGVILPGQPFLVYFSHKVISWFQLVMATPVIFWAGKPFFERGWTSVKTMKLNMFTLIALGISAAYFYSLVGVLFPDWFPLVMRADGAVQVYFEAATVITVLVLLGQVLEFRARQRTGSAIRALLDLSPKRARRVLDNGKEENIDL